MKSTVELEFRLLSHSFAGMLMKYDNPIAKKLLELNVSERLYQKECTRNITLRKNREMSFCPKGKETIITYNEERDVHKWCRSNRQNGKYGKILRKVLTEQCPDFEFIDKDMEELVNLLKAEVSSGTFSVVEGDEIALFYKQPKPEGEGSLSGSCMQGKPKNFFDLYTQNKGIISMLVLVKDNGQLIGRALLWKTKNEIYMDRIYGSDHNIAKFKAYAREKGWYHKKHQSYDYGDSWITPRGETVSRIMDIYLEDVDFEEYPYLDTFCFLYDDGRVSNSGGTHDKTLRCTGGGWDEDENYAFCEYSEERYHLDYLTYIDGYGYVHNEYAVYDDLEDDYILEEDSVRLYDDRITSVNNCEVVYCERDNEYAHIDDTFTCEHDDIHCISDRNTSVYLDELCMTVLEDNEEDAYFDAGFVQDEETGQWMHQDDYDELMEERESNKAA